MFNLAINSTIQLYMEFEIRIRREKKMEKTYEGYWFKSHQNSGSLKKYGLYKENKYHQSNVYDDDVTNGSHVDDCVADHENENLLSGCDITMGLQQFLEIGMKYKITVEVKDTTYRLQIENI